MAQCTSCGAALAPGAAQCPHCGAAAQPPAPYGYGQPAQPAQGGYGQPQAWGPPAGGPGYGAPMHAGPPPGPVPPFIGWAIAALVQSVMCGNPFLGIPAAVLAFLGKNEWDQGRAESALGKLKIAKVLAIIGFSLIGLGALAYVLILVFAMAAGATSSTY